MTALTLKSYQQTLKALTDRLIGHMGFEALDVASMIAAPAAYPLWGEDFESSLAAQLNAVLGS